MNNREKMIMRKIIPVILVLLVFLLFSCSEFFDTLQGNNQGGEPTAPATPGDGDPSGSGDEAKTILLPVSIYDLQQTDRGIQVDAANLCDENGIPNEVYGSLTPAFAGLGQQSIGSDSKYEMNFNGRVLSWTVSEDEEFFYIEGVCEENDAYAYYKMAKDNSALSFIESRILEIQISESMTIQQAFIFYAPSISISEDVYEGHCYGLAYLTDGSKGSDNRVTCVNIYLHKDPEFLGLLYIEEDSPIELSDIPATEMTEEGVKAIAFDPAVEAVTGPTDGGHLGTIIFYREENDFAFEAELPENVNRTFDEYKAEALSCNPNWVI